VSSTVEAVPRAARRQERHRRTDTLKRAAAELAVELGRARPGHRALLATCVQRTQEALHATAALEFRELMSSMVSARILPDGTVFPVNIGGVSWNLGRGSVRNGFARNP